MGKVISMTEGTKYVKSGMMLALGGMTLYRRPVAFVNELIRSHHSTGLPNLLTLLVFTASLESDLLVGSGMISTVRSCYFGLESFGLAPMFTYFANRGEITIIEETEASIASGLRAKLAGIGFMPAKAWIGTDLPKLRPDVKTIRDPYTGEELMAFPSIEPDIAVIHAIKADTDGNAIIGMNKGVDEELTLAAKTVIITAEEIVPKLPRADLVAPLITAVIHAPHGAAPTSCYPLYPIDGLSILEYTEKVHDPESWEKYIQEKLLKY
ncbi:MAG: CoA transferase subunit A [Anaerolineales bacterium]|nr:CoA transferase subunit A [Anaerolineales bacterium]